MTSRRVAGRYAEALFGLARDRGRVDGVRAELGELTRLVGETPGLADLLARPDLGAERKVGALEAALGERVSEVMLGLLAALVRHRRGEYVPAVWEAFGELADEAAGVVRAEATTAVPLTEGQRERLVAALRGVTGKRVALEERVEPEVLAGVRLQVGQRLIDGSAAGRLARMREELVRLRS